MGFLAQRLREPSGAVSSFFGLAWANKVVVMAPPSLRPVKGSEKAPPRKDPFALGPGRKLRLQISKLNEELQDLPPERVLREQLQELAEIQALGFRSPEPGAGTGATQLLQSYQERAVRLEAQRRHEALYRSHRELIRRRERVEQEAARAAKVREKCQQREEKLQKELDEAGGPPDAVKDEVDHVRSSESIEERRLEQRTLRRTREVLEVHLEELRVVKEEVLELSRMDVEERQKRIAEAWKDGPAIHQLDVPEGEKHGLVLPKAAAGSDPEAPVGLDGLLIAGVADGSPAAEFGVLGLPCTRWRLLAVNGTELKEKTETQVQEELLAGMAVEGEYYLTLSEDPENPPDPVFPPGTGECVYRSLNMLTENAPKPEVEAEDAEGDENEGEEGEGGDQAAAAPDAE